MVVGSMTAAELRQTIYGPAKAAGIEVIEVNQPDKATRRPAGQDRHPRGRIRRPGGAQRRAKAGGGDRWRCCRW